MFTYKTYIIFIFYILGTFLFKETHPFSRFPMYNNFPNWSYVFFISNQNHELVPSMTNFNISGGWIGHTFYALCHSEGIKYGDNMETKEELKNIGEKMFKQITSKNQSFLEEHDTLYFHKIYFSIENNKIVKKDEIIYAHYNQ